MIDRPLFEKTFEPASLGNAEINKKIFENMASMQTVRELKTERNKINKLYQFLKKLGFVTSLWMVPCHQTSSQRGISLWGQFNSTDSRSILAGLEEQGFIAKVNEYQIDQSEYLNAYEKQFPLSNADFARVKNQAIQK